MIIFVNGEPREVTADTTLRDVLDRHEVLRTRYPRTADGSGARQEIIEPAAAAAEVRFGRRVVDDVAGAVDRFLGRVFDVTEEIPLQIALFSAADGEGDDSAGRPEQVLAAVVHHIAADGVSFETQVDVVEWLGNEQYAYLPFEAPDELLGTLDKRARYAVEARFGLLDGERKSFREVGENLGVTAEAARRLVSRAVAGLREDAVRILAV